MCGICGIKGSVSQVTDKYMERMLNALYHRGPDEKGEYYDEDVFLGIRRLSIIDLKTGSQPIYNEDKGLIVVCNGEIYNFYKLRDSLIKKGHNFYTNSDVEVIVHLYEEYNVDCLKYIKGMFSFALWDKNNKILFIARDRFGIKPLYYYNSNGIFAFSSELKALLKLPFINKELNRKAVSLYFSLEYIPSPYSVLQDIYKLKPAHYMLHTDNNLEIHRYWDLKSVSINNNLSFFDAKDKFKEMFGVSIKEHLVSDVPLGIFLSGGIDSSALVALAKEFCNQDLSTFSIGFEEKSFDESKYACFASRYFRTQHYNYIFTINDFIDNFYNIVSSLDEPLADLSIFPTYMLSKFSRKYIKVALSGEGADELFMGYPTYIAHKYIHLFNKFPLSFNRIVKCAIDLLPTSFEYFSLDFRLKQFVGGMNQYNPILRHILWMGAFSEWEKAALFSEGFKKEGFKIAGADSDFLKGFMNDLNPKEIYKLIQYLDIFTYLSEDLLVKADRASMLSSLEVRVPYLDHKLVEFIWSLSYKTIYQKKLLKYVSEEFLPKKIIKRPKKGFPIPFSIWTRNKAFFSIIEEFFSKDLIENQGLFNYDYINFLLNQHLSGKKDNRKKLRTYIMFQSWFKYNFCS